MAQLKLKGLKSYICDTPETKVQLSKKMKKKKKKELVTIVMRRRKGIGNKEELVEHGSGEEKNRERVGSDDGSHGD